MDWAMVMLGEGDGDAWKELPGAWGLVFKAHLSHS